MMLGRTIDIGNEAENLALSYLKKQGLKLIERNFSCKLGEIDLIMRDTSSLVFVEVRYRKNISYGSALETVNHQKQRKLWFAAQTYLQRKGLTNQAACRFDVIGITGLKEFKYEWVKNAFMA